MSEEPVRTDFLDYPTAWRIQHEVGDQLRHDPRCSSVEQADEPLAGPGLLCDCGAVIRDWKQRVYRETGKLPENYPDVLPFQCYRCGQTFKTRAGQMSHEGSRHPSASADLPTFG